MRVRALILACALLAATSAHANVALLMERKTVTTATNTGQDQAMSAARRVLESMGQPYNVFKPGATSTDSLRFGSFEIRPGIWQRFTVVIHAGFAAGTQAGSGTIPDNLTLASGFPTNAAVHVFIGNGGASSALTQTTACSTGIASIVATSATRDLPYLVYHCGKPWVYKVQSVRPCVATATRAAPGIWRPLLGYAATRATAATPPADKDACTRSDNPDTLLMWARDLSSIGLTIGGSTFTAGKLLFVQWQGALEKGDARLIASAIAWADSNSSHGIVTDPNTIPVTFGIHIDDGFRRADGSILGGFVDDDSSTAKASLDSLAALGAKMVVGIGCDSVNVYANERAWWKRVPLMHYTPHTHGGTASGVTGNAGASIARPLDIFGVLRSRICIGDFSGAGADTGARASLIRGSFAVCATYFGAGNVDHILMAPLEIWATATQADGTINPDSMFSAFAAGGASGVRCFSLGPPSTTAEVYGRSGAYYSGSTFQRANLGSAVGTNLKLLACADYSGNGTSYAGLGTGSGSVTPDVNVPSVTLVQDYAFNGLLFGAYCTPFTHVFLGSGSVTISYNSWTRCKILVIHASDLCGGRPGYFIIKHAVHSANSINDFAGRRLIQPDYPDNLSPQ